MILALLITEEILLLCNLSGFQAIKQFYEGWDERELSVVYWWGYTDINWNVQKVLSSSYFYYVYTFSPASNIYEWQMQKM